MSDPIEFYPIEFVLPAKDVKGLSKKLVDTIMGMIKPTMTFSSDPSVYRQQLQDTFKETAQKGAADINKGRYETLKEDIRVRE